MSLHKSNVAIRQQLLPSCRARAHTHTHTRNSKFEAMHSHMCFHLENLWILFSQVHATSRTVVWGSQDDFAALIHLLALAGY